MPKTLNEIKQDFLRQKLQFEIRSRVISREIFMAANELKKFQKSRLLTAQHMNEFQKHFENTGKHSSRLAGHMEKISRLIEEEKEDDSICTEDGKVVELKCKDRK